jgi:hypothetical protein
MSVAIKMSTINLHPQTNPEKRALISLELGDDEEALKLARQLANDTGWFVRLTNSDGVELARIPAGTKN